MSKCHVKELENLYSAFSKDVLYAYPALRDELSKDLVRLSRLLAERGIHTLCEDLPNLAKHLDRCLAEGQYKLSGLPLSQRYSKRVVIPKLFRGLYLLIFEESGLLKEDYDEQALVMLRQFLLLAKKTKLTCSDENIAQAVRDFLEVDQGLPEPQGFWKTQGIDYPTGSWQTFCQLLGDPSFPGSVPRSLLVKLDKIASLVASALGDYRRSEWKFRHGPGAISERTGPTNKYCWSNWSDRLEYVYPIADCGYHNHGSWATHADDGVGSDDPNSRLISVDKTFTKPRLIAAEPSEHMWCQQNIWHYMCDRVRGSWINGFVRFRDQSQNQELCRIGSRDSKLATIDLSAASDRMTCRVVEGLFWRLPALMESLNSTRTRQISYEADSNPSFRRYSLRKFSTMGSACTFPVQSLVFLSCCIAATLETRKLEPTLKAVTGLMGEVTVFGDDLVVPEESAECLVMLLEFLHFKVNAHKSFFKGNFKESCGVECFNGTDVSAVYWSGPNDDDVPEKVASTLSVANNFQKKFYLHTANYLRSTIRKFNFPIVSMDSGVVGHTSFTVPRTSQTKRRYNEELQRSESLVPTIIGKVTKAVTNDDTALHQYFTEEPDALLPWRHGFVEQARCKIKHRWVPTDTIAG